MIPQNFLSYKTPEVKTSKLAEILLYFNKTSLAWYIKCAFYDQWYYLQSFIKHHVIIISASPCKATIVSDLSTFFSNSDIVLHTRE